MNDWTMGGIASIDGYDPATPDTFADRFPATPFADRFPASNWTMGETAAPQAQGELRSADVPPSQHALWATQEALTGLGADPYNAGKLADIAHTIGGFTPAGSVLSGADLPYNLQRGNYGSAALDVLGLVPGVGPVMRGARALGPIGRAAVGAGALGGALLASDQAEAGPLDKAAKAAGRIGSLFEAPKPGVGGPSYLSPADQALFASRYPQAGAFIEKPKDSGVGTYRSKIPTDEEARLAAARDKVRADMETQGYTPYFDPSQRYDVDYQQYLRLFGQPDDTSTLTKKIMKGDPPQLDMRALDKAYKVGAGLGEGPFGFYKMGQLEREFIDHYGEDEGRRQFVNRFSAPMAATTSGVTPAQNFLLSQYGNFMRETGAPLPAVKGEAYNIPYPVGGGKYGPTGNLQQYEKALYPGGAGINWEVNPKRYDFDWSFRGRRDAPVIDEQMMKGMTGEPQGAEAAKGGYGYYSNPVSARAAKLGVDPIQYQEVGWAGLKHQGDVAAAIKRGATKAEAKAQAFQGQPMITDVNDVIERTSRLLQIPPAEVVRRGLVESKLPIYALPAGLGLGAGAMGSTVAPELYSSSEPRS